MAIPGNFTFELPEGSYTENQPIWLWGSNNDGVRQSKKFNAANLAINGSGNVPSYNSAHWFSLATGNPNLTISALAMGDFTVVLDTGRVFRADAAGNMSWNGSGSFTWKANSNGGSSSVNTGISTNMNGFVFGNGNNLSAVPITVLDFGNMPVAGRGLVFPGNQDGIYFDATGVVITADGGSLEVGPGIGSNWLSISTLVPQMLVGGPGLTLYSQLTLGRNDGYSDYRTGSIGINATSNNPSFFDGSAWIDFLLVSIGPSLSYKGPWDSGTTYNNGDTVFSGLELWFVLGGPSTPGTAPQYDDGVWLTFESIFFSTFTADNSLTGDLSLKSWKSVLDGACTGMTYADGTNLTQILNDMDFRLRNIETAMAAAGDGNATVLAADGIGTYNLLVAAGLLTIS